MLAKHNYRAKVGKAETDIPMQQISEAKPEGALLKALNFFLSVSIPFFVTVIYNRFVLHKFDS